MSMPDLNTGALAPVSDEFDGFPATVSGEIPLELNGTLIRNGPNPFSGRFAGEGVLSWWPEAAMLHGVTFSDGVALAYRNRWVRTKGWADHCGARSTGQLLDSNPPRVLADSFQQKLHRRPSRLFEFALVEQLNQNRRSRQPHSPQQGRTGKILQESHGRCLSATAATVNF